MSNSSHADVQARHLPLSVLIPVKNEAQNIEACLRSVAFADEIVVVDSQSTDGTVEIALDFGARVVQFHWNGQYPKKKNWALANVDWKHEWLLIVDADERITPELQSEISAAIESKESAGYYLNRCFMFMGRWIRHCGYYPSWNLRLFRHELGRYEQLEHVGDTGSGDNEVHEHVVLEGDAARLRNDMLHYAYPSVSVWIEKHNRYSNWEAHVARSKFGEGSSSKLSDDSLQRNRRLREFARGLPLSPLTRFLYHYIVRQGFRDGYPGWVLCRLLGWYEFVSMVKARELRLRGD